MTSAQRQDWQIPATRHAEVLATFEAAAQDANVISFDLFDTLLLRMFARPIDLFAALGDDLAQTIPIPAQSFAYERVKAEKRARATARRAARPEVTLAEIYSEMPVAMMESLALHRLDQSALMRREAELELTTCFPDEQAVATFHRLVARPVPVVIMSDTYLPTEYVLGMIERIGVSGQVFVQISCEVGASKANGSAWPTLRRRLGLAADARIVHLGDNAQADGFVARAAGVESYLLPSANDRRPRHRLTANPDWLVGSCEALFLRALRRGVRCSTGRSDVDIYWLTIAYLVVLPVALGFAIYLHDLAKKEKASGIFFLARDGLIFKTVYDAVVRQEASPESRYVWASRRCLNLASIVKLDQHALDFLVSGASPLSPRQAIERIDLDPDKPAIAIPLASHFPDATRKFSLGEREPLRQFWPAIEPEILTRAATERTALLQHLDEIGLFEKRALLVDLGWHGTLQRSLSRLARGRGSQELQIHGAYLGTMSDAPREIEGTPVSGWLFEAGRPAHHLRKTVATSVEMVELMFSAPESGIKYIEFKDGVPVPVRQHDPQEAPRLAVAALIHAEVSEAARMLRPLIPLLHASRLRDTAVSQLAALLQHPDAEDIANARTVSHAEGFGVDIYVPIVAPPPRVTEVSALLSAYRSSFWRTAFRAALPSYQKLLLDLLRFVASARRRTRTSLNKLTSISPGTCRH